MQNIEGNIIFEHCPRIMSYASVVGKKEGEGPLKEYFDRIVHDSYFGKDTFEQAESEMMRLAVQGAIEKSGLKPDEGWISCCGDLLNQCVASSFAMRSSKVLTEIPKSLLIVLKLGQHSLSEFIRRTIYDRIINSNGSRFRLNTLLGIM